jgi:hypothetical protein
MNRKWRMNFKYLYHCQHTRGLCKVAPEVISLYPLLVVSGETFKPEGQAFLYQVICDHFIHNFRELITKIIVNTIKNNYETVNCPFGCIVRA